MPDSALKTKERVADLLPRVLTPAILLSREGEVQEIACHQGFGLSSPTDRLKGRAFESLVTEAGREDVRRAIERCAASEGCIRVRARWSGDATEDDEPPLRSLLFHRLGERIVVVIEETPEIETLQQRLDDSAELLALYREVADVTNSVTDIDEAVECVLRRVARFNGWEFGHAFLRDPADPDLLLPEKAAYAAEPGDYEAFSDFTSRCRWRRGEGLPGRVAAESKAILTTDFDQDLCDRRRELAKQLGLRTAFGFPIMVDAEVVGVLEFFSSESLGGESRLEFDAIAAIGIQLGRVVERERMRLAREESEENLRLMTERLRDAVWTYDSETLETSYANPALHVVWKTPREGLTENAEAWTERVVAQDRSRVLRALEEIRNGSPMDEEFRIYDEDGSTRWIRCRGFPIENGGEQVRSIAATAEDITEHKDSQAARARLERELRDVAEEERRRAARDLHDDLGGVLSAIDMRVEVLRSKLKEGQQPEAESIEAIISLAREAMGSSRRLTRGLSPVGDDPDELRTALREMLDTIHARGEVNCRLRAEQEVPLSEPVVANQLFRIAQEAVTNALKHSGASNIEVELFNREDAVMLSIVDDGKGLAPSVKGKPGHGHGLSIMEYRAQDIGADLTLETGTGGRGTRLTCKLPRQTAG